MKTDLQVFENLAHVKSYDQQCNAILTDIL